jgi:hypothetical protein
MGRKTLILDPLRDSRWIGNVTDNPQEFLGRVETERQAALFIDESGETVGRYKEEMFWLATRARHFGHDSHFICQRAQQLNLTVRNQCSALCVFRVSDTDAKILADENASPELREAPALGLGECIYIKQWPVRAVKRFNVFGRQLRRVA